MARPIKVLIVDDSALIQRLLTKILESDSEIEVVGCAADPYVAREMIKKLNPDVLTLDVEMPKMDGITFLGHLMRLRPMPVVMISSLTQKGAETTFQALDLGAVDFIGKPETGTTYSLEDYSIEIIGKVKVAVNARLQTSFPVKKPDPTALGRQSNQSQASSLYKYKNTVAAPAKTAIAIGASTGGTEAIKHVLACLPSTTPAIVITQHIPANFSAPFALRINNNSAMTVKEADHGDQILHGHAYIAPGGKHLRVVSRNGMYYCEIDDGPPVNRHKPSVNVLFNSVAECFGSNATGVILTGMGDDGATGLKLMRESGALTIAQDEATSVVWGMPGSAVKIDAADKVLPLNRVADLLIDSGKGAHIA